MSILKELKFAAQKPLRGKDAGVLNAQNKKKNFAERLSRALAQKVADALRKDFPGVLPLANGARHESRARTGKGPKKLDVNYSTIELGLGLGVTIKTLSFADKKSGRYTKNYTRVDNELRAEAKDYHQRQPYAVLVGLIFLPVDACFDAKSNDPSSFGAAVRMFRYRTGRKQPSEEQELLERVFLCVFETEGKKRGEEWYFDVQTNPPLLGKPLAACRFSWEQLLVEIKKTYDTRNFPPFAWADDADLER